MAKNKRQKASRQKTKQGKTKALKALRKLEVPISPSKATIQEVELAIANKLATQPTDLFMKNEKVIIEIEQFEDKGHRGE